MSANPLKVGVAGCGGISRVTFEAARANPDLEIVALMDPDADARRALGKDFGVLRRHDRFEELLSEPVDFLVLNSPNDVHRDQVLAAVEAGRPCLVQKPFARTLAEADAMLAHARRCDVPVGVLMLELGEPIHHEIRRMIREGWLGRPTLVHACIAHDRYLHTPPPAEDWRSDPERIGGGAFLQLAVHSTHLVRWLLGERYLEVAAHRVRGELFSDETTVAVARLECGAVATFAASYATSDHSLTLAGTEGRIVRTGTHLHLDGRRPFAGSLLRYETPGKTQTTALASLAGTAENLRPGLEMHGRFGRWLRGEDEYPSPGTTGRADLEFVDAVRRAVEERRWVPLRETRS